MFHSYLCPLLQFPAFYCVESIFFYTVTTLIIDLIADPFSLPDRENTQEKKSIVSLPQFHTLFLERDNREVKVIVTELQRVHFSQMNSWHPLLKSLHILQVLPKTGLTAKPQFTERHSASPPTDSARTGISQECSGDLSLLCPPQGICKSQQALPSTARHPLPTPCMHFKTPVVILTAQPHLSQSKILSLDRGIHPPGGRRGNFSSLIGTFPN